jgi:hypothetical protein
MAFTRITKVKVYTNDNFKDYQRTALYTILLHSFKKEDAGYTSRFR